MPSEAPSEKHSELSLDDLRKIMHSLRMSNFAFLEPSVLSIVDEKIKAFPSPENLDQIAETPMALKQIREQIGEVMQIIDHYGTKGAEYKIRYKSLTKLPPRYKILDWKKACAKEMIKISKIADECGQGSVADYLINNAEAILKDKIDLNRVIDVTSGNGLDTGYLRKLAQMPVPPTIVDGPQGADLQMGNTETYKQLQSLMGNVEEIMKNETWSEASAKQVISQVTAVSDQLAVLEQTMTQLQGEQGSEVMSRNIQSINDIIGKYITSWKGIVQEIEPFINKANEIVAKKTELMSNLRNNGYNITQNT